MTHGIFEFLWLKIILDDLKIKWTCLMRLYYENKFEINIIPNTVQYDRTKHVKVDQNFIKIDSSLICTPYIGIGGQLEDVLAKVLANTTF